MQSMVLAVPPRLRAPIRRIFCDSKAGRAYGLTLFGLSYEEALEIAQSVEAVLFHVQGGHNGIALFMDGVDNTLVLYPAGATEE